MVVMLSFLIDNKRLDEWVDESRLDLRKIQYPRKDLGSTTTGLNTPKKTLNSTTTTRPNSPAIIHSSESMITMSDVSRPPSPVENHVKMVRTFILLNSSFLSR